MKGEKGNSREPRLERRGGLQQFSQADFHGLTLIPKCT